MITGTPSPRSLLRRVGHQAAVAILTHDTLAAAAASLNLHPNTIYFWSKNSWFQRQVDIARRELRQELIRAAVAAGVTAPSPVAERLVPEDSGEWAEKWRRPRKAAAAT